MKTRKIDVHIDANSFEATTKKLPFVKVVLSTFPNFSNSSVLGEFFIPTSTYLKGYKEFMAAVKARAKHDLNIEIGHNSWCGV